MRSVVHKAFGQILETGQVHLFKSYRSDYADGEQVRDFIYVKDVVEVIWWLLNQREVNGLFNLGTGQARSWKDLVNAVFTAMAKPRQIDFIDMPETLRDRYQYHTQAVMNKLMQAGYPIAFKSLEDGICDYIQNYLMSQDPYL
jgi:ADP-L-glycero-D-manno-heptose 6-epimerase